MWHHTEEELLRLAILLNGFTSSNATYSYGVEYTDPGQDSATSLSHVAFFRSLARCLCPCLNFCLWLSSVCCSTLGTKLCLPSAISFLQTSLGTTAFVRQSATICLLGSHIIQTVSLSLRSRATNRSINVCLSVGMLPVFVR